MWPGRKKVAAKVHSATKFPRKYKLCIFTYRYGICCRVQCVCVYISSAAQDDPAPIKFSCLPSLLSSLWHSSSLLPPPPSPVSSVQCFTRQPRASLMAVHSTNGALRESERQRGREREREKERERERETGKKRDDWVLSGVVKTERLIDSRAPWARQRAGHTAGDICRLQFFLQVCHAPECPSSRQLLLIPHTDCFSFMVDFYVLISSLHVYNSPPRGVKGTTHFTVCECVCVCVCVWQGCYQFQKMHKITAINTENNQARSPHLLSLCACEKCIVAVTGLFQINSDDIAAGGQ